jgi:hypothetical protein
VQDLGFVVGQLVGDKALAVDGGLLADVVGRYLGQVGAGDLDKVAKDLVVTDLQRRDSGSLALAFFDAQDVIFAALGQIGQLV